MSLKELRVHLVNECNKITMQCNICGELMRRPWVPHHECVRVYRVRINDKDEEISTIQKEVFHRDNMISGLQD
jgi:hypothetical protein